MMEELNQPQREPRPLWRDLLEIQKAIDVEMKKIDRSGPNFLARDIVLNELRKRYNWYEKWESTTPEDREKWVFENQRGQIHLVDKLTLRKLAENNYKVATDFYTPKDLGNVDNVLSQVENDTLEREEQELEEIKKTIETEDIEWVKGKFLEYISRLKREVIYQNMTVDEKASIEGYEQSIKYLQEKSTYKSVLPIYLNQLIEIIKRKKKGKKK